MSHHYKSYKHNCSKYSEIKKQAVDFDGNPSFVHRCHRTKSNKCGVPSKKRDLINEICDDELGSELGDDIKRHLKL